MGYQEAMEAAGAEVLTFECFGSYQGDWWALVHYQNKKGWVHGCFGSCSGCDAFEAEFGWFDKEEDPDYIERLIRFGKAYLEDLYTQEEAEKRASEHLSWDLEAAEVLAFLKKNAIKGRIS